MSESKVYHTACHLCHGSCIAEVTVADGKVTDIRPDQNGVFNTGRMCPKGLLSKELIYNPHRLLHPMKRTGPRGSGQFERITWVEAYDIIRDNLLKIEAKYGMEAVAIAQGTGRHHLPYTARFANCLGTPNWFEPGSAQCFFPRIHAGAVTFGFAPAADYYSDTPPELMLVWGCNPSISGADGESRYCFLDTLKRGTRLIVVDPCKNNLEPYADHFLQLRPGTDDALALGILHVLIFEDLYDHEFVENWCYGFAPLKERVKKYTPELVSQICGIPAEAITAAARRIGTATTVSMEWGCAIEHTPNCFQTVRAIALILAITGNIDKKGGFIENMHVLDEPEMLEDHLGDEKKKKRMGEQYKMLAGAHKPFSSAHIPTVFEAMRTGKPYPIRALMMCGNNGLLGFADSQKTLDTWMGLDFICCQDQFLTPSALLADVVLPVCTWLEVDSLTGGPGGADHVILCQRAVVPPVGECKTDETIFMEICQHLGKDWGASNLDDILDKRLDRLRTFPGYEDMTLEKLRETGWVAVPIQYEQYKERAARGEKAFNTPTGKIELYSTIMEEFGFDPLPDYREPPESPLSTPELLNEYPLILTTGTRINAFFLSEQRQVPSLRKQNPYPIATLHPDTASQYGIADGDWIFIETKRGRITQKARVTPNLKPGVVNCQIGWWIPEATEKPFFGAFEVNANVLTTMEPPFDPCMGTYQLRGMLCRVYPNPDAKDSDYYRPSRL
ncbi:MAG: molybdopterin-dependent oxidoreductase [Oscillospiraceae bacterium]|nr:molybdopterin-dependent oxidoreductase [Oscillospiraceae bacterium]